MVRPKTSAKEYFDGFPFISDSRDETPSLLRDTDEADDEESDAAKGYYYSILNVSPEATDQVRSCSLASFQKILKNLSWKK